MTLDKHQAELDFLASLIECKTQQLLQLADDLAVLEKQRKRIVKDAMRQIDAKKLLHEIIEDEMENAAGRGNGEITDAALARYLKLFDNRDDDVADLRWEALRYVEELSPEIKDEN